MASPVCCFLGHVDAGKTSLLDSLRKSKVCDQEIGGITQQIGSTYFSKTALDNLTGNLSKNLEISGLLILDTPGHDCFTSMRLIGLRVSHLPIIIVDVIKGLEKQTKNCIELLTQYNIPFIIALNKIDRIFGWTKSSSKSLKESLKKQNKSTLELLKKYADKISSQLSEFGISANLYYENYDPRNVISMVPVSAKTGEGLADLIVLISKLTAKKINDFPNDSYGYIIETKLDENYGLLCYALLYANELHKNDEIILERATKVDSLHSASQKNGNVDLVCDTNNNNDDVAFTQLNEVNQSKIIRTTVKNLLAVPEQKEMKNKISFKSVQNITGTCGFGIKFSDDRIYDEIIPGTFFMKKYNQKLLDAQIKIDQLVNEIKYEKTGIIINVPTKGMGYAIINILNSNTERKIPIQEINVGIITKITVIKASVTNDNYKNPVILDYNNLYKDDVIYYNEITELCKKSNVKIIHSNVVHELIDKLYKFLDEIENEKESDFQLEILPNYIFLKRSPLMFGVKTVSGTLNINSIVMANKNGQCLKLGKVTSIQTANKNVTSTKTGTESCIRITQDENDEKYEYGKDFDEHWMLTN